MITFHMNRCLFVYLLSGCKLLSFLLRKDEMNQTINMSNYCLITVIIIWFIICPLLRIFCISPNVRDFTETSTVEAQKNTRLEILADLFTCKRLIQ